MRRLNERGAHPQRTRLLLLAAIVVFAAVSASAVLDRETQEASGETARRPATVSRVVDGDTIVVMLGGEEVRVRYIGVDAPETVRPGSPVEPFGPESHHSTRRWGRQGGRLERDVSDTDRFGRLLRYVLADGRMVNAVLVEQGYARAITFPPDVRHAADLMRLEREARTAGRGLWGQR